MLWIKKGLIYGPDERMPWAVNSALTPTPVLMGDVIRVYSGFRDTIGVSRIGFVDVDAANPNKILRVSKSPVLNVGQPGTFDDNGVILGDVIQLDESRYYMYYVGFQLVKNIKFLAFTGLAISDNGGDTFERVSEAPILDRADEAMYIRAIHSVIRENNVFKVWYATGSSWTEINGVQYPDYHICYTESPDGIVFPKYGQTVIRCCGDEYRIGRPRVYYENGRYRMFYTKGTRKQEYFPGYAESSDGLNWVRADNQLGISLSEEGWDSQTLCYPSLIKYRNQVYMFYNGNSMGRDGFGYAELYSTN